MLENIYVDIFDSTMEEEGGFGMALWGMSLLNLALSLHCLTT